MRRLQFAEYGPPEVLKFKHVEKPVPGGQEALIEIKAAAINPSDLKNVAGSFNTPLPQYRGGISPESWWRGLRTPGLKCGAAGRGSASSGMEPIASS